MQNDYAANRDKLAERLKTVPTKLPIQEIKEVVKKPEKVPESHVNFWLPKTLLDEIKILGIKKGKNFKTLATEALEELLKRHK